jgi:hypothetical protein
MTRRSLFAIAVTLFILPVAWSDPEEEFNRAEVEKLIGQLSDKAYAVRQKASKELEQLGPEVLPLFRETIQKTGDPEVRRQLEELVPKLERQAALAPKFITLQCKDKPLREAIKELARQSGYKIELSTPAGANDERERRLVTLDLKNVSFWDALERVCGQGGLAVHEGWYGPDQAMVRLDFGEMNPGVVSVHGPFRVRVMGSYYNRSLNFNNFVRTPNDQVFHRYESLSINLGVSVEPKLPLLGLGQPTITEAVDDQDQSLTPPPNPSNNQYHPSYYRSYMQQISTTLTPSRAGRRLKVLKGVVPVTVVAATTPKIVVEKLTDVKNKTFKEGATTLTIDEVTRKNNNQISVKMTISEGRNGPSDYTWVNSLPQRLEVTDGRGVKYQSYGHSWSGGNNSVQGTFEFGPSSPVANPLAILGLGPGPLKLVYNEWSTLVHPVPFEFKDLPLP